MPQREDPLTDSQLRQLLRLIEAGKSEEEMADELARSDQGQRVELDAATIRSYKRACEIHCQLCVGKLKRDLGVTEGSPVLDWILRRLREADRGEREAEAAESPERAAHWRDLTALAQRVLLGIRVSAPHSLWLMECCPNITEDLDGLDALSMLFCGKAVEVDKGLYANLLAHMEGEFPDWRADMAALREAAVGYCRALNSVASRIVAEAEKRTGLPYDPSFRYGLGGDFGATVCEAAASWKRQKLAYCREGIELKYGSHALVRVAMGEEEKLAQAQNVHGSMVGEVRSWPELQNALELYGRIQEASARLKQALAQVVLWSEFTNSTCPGCPK